MSSFDYSRLQDYIEASVVQQYQEGVELLVLCEQCHGLQLTNFEKINRLERTYMKLVLLTLSGIVQQDRDRGTTLRLGGTVSDSILGGGRRRQFFLLTLYNIKNIGGRT